MVRGVGFKVTLEKEASDRDSSETGLTTVDLLNSFVLKYKIILNIKA